MSYTLIRKQLLKIAQNYKLNYRCTLNCFTLENEKNSSLSVAFNIGCYYSFIIKNDGCTKYLDKLSDFKTLYLLCVLEDNLNVYPFSNALKEMYNVYKKIQEIEEELKNNENSTN